MADMSQQQLSSSLTPIAIARRAFDQASSDPANARALIECLSRPPWPDDLAQLITRIATAHAGDAGLLAQLVWVARAADLAEHVETLGCAVLQRHPEDSATRHNVATHLREQARTAEALTLISAGDTGARPPESWMLLAHLEADQGNFVAAVTAYQKALSTAPDLLPAHESLARLLPQIGAADQALESYWSALATQPDNKALWASAIGTAKALRFGSALETLAASACDRFGAAPDLLIALALGFAFQGQRDLAIAQLDRVVTAVPHAVAAHLHLAPLLLEVGDLERAEQSATAATQLDPLDQSGWAWLSILWRLTEDPREQWLIDYERHILLLDLQEDIEAALGTDGLTQLVDYLSACHTTTSHPLDQSARGGTQTRGDLFARRDKPLLAFKMLLQRRVEAALQALSPVAGHPFLGRLSDQGIAFAGAWSIRLREAGHHAHHIHHKGWLSSAFYAALPPSVGQTGSDAGALIFGVPEVHLPHPLAPRRILIPQPGHLALFPSYTWHGTVPFLDAHPRLTLAFDALPAS
jgi:tetratricopeptide (TPR) repeat protein